MQEYYNQISKQKRIAFIDNLTDDMAKTISSQYPFAVCFANNIADNEFPVIWFNGKRYGFTKVNTSTINIGDICIGLNVDENGVLGLSYQRDLIYIGNRENIVGDEIEKDIYGLEMISDFTYSGVSGWHLINTYNFNDKDIEINENTVILLPVNYSLCLPIFEDMTLSNPISDPMWNESSYVTVNGKRYILYTFNSDNFGTSNKLLSIIKKN